jgi:hypothetical protein
MAPLPDSSSILSSLNIILRRTPSPIPSPTISDLSPKVALLAARAQNLLPRATLQDPSSGVTPPQNINNNAIFALFGLIGAGMIVTGIWFFFWAKNGGFYFKDNDWDEYKSTVLRRKGPNGTTLSGATASTDLGGGSVVHGEKNSRWGRGKKNKKNTKRYKDFDEESEITGSAGGSTLASEMSELKWKAGKDKKNKKAKKESRLRGGDGGEPEDEDEEVDAGVRDALRTYRHEKPARVGGLNKQPDGSAWDGSTNDNSTAASELLSNREHTPTNTPTKIKRERKDNYTGGTGGIRKVVSTSNGGSSSFWSRAAGSDKKKNEEEDRVKAEAKKLQDKGRAVQRRDFSFSVGDDGSNVSGSGLNDEERQARRERREARRASRSPTKKVPGSYYEASVMGSEVSGDLGTKSYHHPIPGLSSTAGSEYAEERRKKRGYRRDEK